MINHEIQKNILSKCSFKLDGATFSELNTEEVESDKFNYHLQYLVKNKYLSKKQGRYTLTQKGKSIVTNIDHETKDISLNYKVSVYMFAVIDKKVLLYKRLKHPQYGYTGAVSGKITYGENVLDTAKREFSEETGLKAEFKIIGNLRQIRKDIEGKVVEDGIFYVCFTDQVQGELIERNVEGEYFWVPIDDISSLEKIFKPSLEMIVSEINMRLSGEKSWDDKFIYELEPPIESY